MSNKQWVQLLLPVVILGVAFSVFAYMKATKPEREKPVAREKVWQVEAIPAVRSTLSPSLTLYGEVESRSLLKAAAPGAGLVQQVIVNPGDQVAAGQLLVVLDQRDFTASLLQAEADVADIEAQLAEHDLNNKSNQLALKEEEKLLELARQEVTRVERLRNNKLSSDSAVNNAQEVLGKQELSTINKRLEVDRYKTTRKQLQARLARARARLAETQLALERSEISAPFDAVIAEVPVTAGDRVRVADTLVSFYPFDSLEIRARIPVSYQYEIQQALEQGSGLAASARLNSATIDFELLRLAGQADTSGIDAFFNIRSGAENLRIGNLIKLELQRPPQQDVISVPFRAIYGNDRLFLLRDSRMKAVEVDTLGQYEADNGQTSLLVKSDEITDQDRIITTHLPNAVDGLKVKAGKGKGQSDG